MNWGPLACSRFLLFALVQCFVVKYVKSVPFELCLSVRFSTVKCADSVVQPAPRFPKYSRSSNNVCRFVQGRFLTIGEPGSGSGPLSPWVCLATHGPEPE